MFDIGFSELMVVAVVALIVIGPERLPRVARTLGGYLMYRFGRLPAPGDEWPVNKGRFRVAAVESNRIEIIDFERDSAAREMP